MIIMSKIGNKIPDVTFNTRVRDESVGGDNPFRWQDVTTGDIFNNKKVVVFSLPGAFTPTCSTMQVPGYENNAEAFAAKGVDSIVCVSVNDSFVMNKWAETVVDGGLQNVKVIPDGSGNFTRYMGMLVGKNHVGFGNRSWRYMAVINDGIVEQWWQEPGINNEGSDSDPYGQTTPDNMIEYLDTDEISID